MYGYGQVPMPEDGGSLSPLPEQMRRGLLAVAILSGLSIASSALLFFYLTWRMLKWKLVPAKKHTPTTPDESLNVDLSLGLSEQHYRQYIQSTQATRGSRTTPLRRLSSGTVATTKPASINTEVTPTTEDDHSNPIIILIYHLLLADVQQSAAFVISACWLQYDGIYVPSVPCYAQGWLLGLAKLASAGFLSIISVNTYLNLVWGFKTSRTWIYSAIGFNWVFAFGCTLGGVLGTQTGMAHGGYYVRTGAWCWINPRYEALRLWLEYFWIFLAMGLTIVLHGLVFWSLWRNNHSARALPPPASSRNSFSTMAVRFRTPQSAREVESQTKMAGRPSGHHPAFLFYPLIYIICVSPLAIARCVDMSRGTGTVNPGYYLVAGALLACHGWINALLWTTTVIFVNPRDAKDTGLDRFAFMRTPHGRRFGNMIWVQGGSHGGSSSQGLPETTIMSRLKTWLGARNFSRSVSNSLTARGYLGPNSISQESLQHSMRNGRHGSVTPPDITGGIQMEVVTTIVVEREEHTEFSSQLSILGFPLESPTQSRTTHSTLHKSSLEGLRDWRF